LIPPPQVDLNSLHSVLNIARSQYEVICADLASSLDDFSIDLMRESRRVFVVTTPEVVPLHLAAQRVRSLEKLGLDDRISLLLNRKSSRNQALSRSLTPQLEPKETTKRRKFLEFFHVPRVEESGEVWQD
jgi:MinD-like ATPase involved in chromosome partitioning or flagellar assembly